MVCLQTEYMHETLQILIRATPGGKCFVSSSDTKDKILHPDSWHSLFLNDVMNKGWS
jgi:hypothetical protein